MLDYTYTYDACLYELTFKDDAVHVDDFILELSPIQGHDFLDENISDVLDWVILKSPVQKR